MSVVLNEEEAKELGRFLRESTFIRRSTAVAIDNAIIEIGESMFYLEWDEEAGYRARAVL